MSDTKNALAKLAEDLEVLKAILDWEYHPKGLEAAEKAQRIVAELSRVGFNERGQPRDEWMACEAVENCLAIAEEGGENAIR